MTEKVCYRAYYDFLSRKGTAPQDQPLADLPKASEQAFLGHYGTLIFNHLHNYYPDFLAYLEYHNHVLDFIEPLQKVMTEAGNVLLEMKLSRYDYPKQEFISREEAEARISLKEKVELSIKKGEEPDPEMYRHYETLGLGKHSQYDGNPEPYLRLVHELSKPTEWQTMQRFIFNVFPLPDDYDDVPFN